MSHSPNALQAAEDALRQLSSPLTGDDREQAKETLAEEFEQYGESRFRLVHCLRRPETPGENAEFELLLGAINEQQYFEVYRTNLDDRLLQEHQVDLQRRLQEYANLLEFISQHRNDSDCPELNWRDHGKSVAPQIKGMLTCRLFTGHFRAVSEFLQEVRILKAWSAASCRGRTSDTASRLADHEMRRVAQDWDQCCEDARKTVREYGAWSGYAEIASPLFAARHLENVAPALDLWAEVQREHTAAKLLLKERKTAQPSTTQIIARVVNQNFNNSSVILQGAPAPTAAQSVTPAANPRKAVLEVESWSDLAIGIDAHRRCWAITPIPEPGAIVPRSAAKVVKLNGKRWQAVLEILAESPDGKSADLKAICVKLDYLNKFVKSPKGSLDAVAIRELPTFKSRDGKKIQGLAPQLSYRLRAHISGPNGEGTLAPLYRNDKVIHSQFVARIITDGPHGGLRFGLAPGNASPR